MKNRDYFRQDFLEKQSSELFLDYYIPGKTIVMAPYIQSNLERKKKPRDSRSVIGNVEGMPAICLIENKRNDESQNLLQRILKTH